MIVAVGCPTVLVVCHIGSVTDRIDSEVPSPADPSEGVVLKEAGTGSAGGREAGAGQQDGSNLTRAVGCLCLRRTWKSPSFRVSSKWGVAGGLPGLVAIEDRHVNIWS